MSCYFRHLGEIFEGTGITVTKENKKELDRLVHEYLHVEYKDCPTAWKTFKETVRGNDAALKKFTAYLEKNYRR